MNSTRKTILTLGSALLLTFGTYACKSSGQSSVNNGTTASSTVAQNSTGDVNTAGLNNSTGAYSGGSAMPGGPANVNADIPPDSTQSAAATAGVNNREKWQAAPADNSYSGTGQTLITSSGSKTASSNTPVNTTSTTTYSTPTTVAPN